MGHRLSANVLRVGLLRSWNSVWYSRLEYTYLVSLDYRVRDFVDNVFYNLKWPISEMRIKRFLSRTVVLEILVYIPEDRFFRRLNFSRFNDVYAVGAHIDLFKFNNLVFDFNYVSRFLYRNVFNKSIFFLLVRELRRYYYYDNALFRSMYKSLLGLCNATYHDVRVIPKRRFTTKNGIIQKTKMASLYQGRYRRIIPLLHVYQREFSKSIMDLVRVLRTKSRMQFIERKRMCNLIYNLFSLATLSSTKFRFGSLDHHLFYLRRIMYRVRRRHEFKPLWSGRTYSRFKQYNKYDPFAGFMRYEFGNSKRSIRYFKYRRRLRLQVYHALMILVRKTSKLIKRRNGIQRIYNKRWLCRIFEPSSSALESRIGQRIISRVGGLNVIKVFFKLLRRRRISKRFFVDSFRLKKMILKKRILKKRILKKRILKKKILKKKILGKSKKKVFKFLRPKRIYLRGLRGRPFNNGLKCVLTRLWCGRRIPNRILNSRTGVNRYASRNLRRLLSSRSSIFKKQQLFFRRRRRQAAFQSCYSITSFRRIHKKYKKYRLRYKKQNGKRLAGQAKRFELNNNNKFKFFINDACFIPTIIHYKKKNLFIDSTKRNRPMVRGVDKSQFSKVAVRNDKHLKHLSRVVNNNNSIGGFKKLANTKLRSRFKENHMKFSTFVKRRLIALFVGMLHRMLSYGVSYHGLTKRVVSQHLANSVFSKGKLHKRIVYLDKAAGNLIRLKNKLIHKTAGIGTICSFKKLSGFCHWRNRLRFFLFFTNFWYSNSSIYYMYKLTSLIKNRAIPYSNRFFFVHNSFHRLLLIGKFVDFFNFFKFENSIFVSVKFLRFFKKLFVCMVQPTRTTVCSRVLMFIVYMFCYINKRWAYLQLFLHNLLSVVFDIMSLPVVDTRYQLHVCVYLFVYYFFNHVKIASVLIRVIRLLYTFHLSKALLGNSIIRIFSGYRGLIQIAKIRRLKRILAIKKKMKKILRAWQKILRARQKILWKGKKEKLLKKKLLRYSRYLRKLRRSTLVARKSIMKYMRGGIFRKRVHYQRMLRFISLANMLKTIRNIQFVRNGEFKKTHLFKRWKRGKKKGFKLYTKLGNYYAHIQSLFFLQANLFSTLLGSVLVHVRVDKFSFRDNVPFISLLANIPGYWVNMVSKCFPLSRTYSKHHKALNVNYVKSISNLATSRRLRRLFVLKRPYFVRYITDRLIYYLDQLRREVAPIRLVSFVNSMIEYNVSRYLDSNVVFMPVYYLSKTLPLVQAKMVCLFVSFQLEKGMPYFFVLKQVGMITYFHFKRKWPLRKRKLQNIKRIIYAGMHGLDKRIYTNIKREYKRYRRNMYSTSILRYFLFRTYLSLSVLRGFVRSSGIRICCSGRMHRRQTRSHTKWFIRGAAPMRTFESYIDYYSFFAVTRLGVLGVKTWIYMIQFNASLN